MASGKPVTTRTLGHMLSTQGKKIWSEYRPYDMRHWCVVARLIKSKVETGIFDVFEVQKLLGCEEITTTNTYISQAVSYYKHLPVDWISLALKPRQKRSEMAGKRDKEKTNRTPFSGLLPEFSRERTMGLLRFERKSMAPEATRIPSYPTGPNDFTNQKEKTNKRVFGKKDRLKIFKDITELFIFLR
jgi:hypothetical protein